LLRLGLTKDDTTVTAKAGCNRSTDELYERLQYADGVNGGWLKPIQIRQLATRGVCRSGIDSVVRATRCERMTCAVSEQRNT